VHYLAGHFEEAIDLCRKAIEIDESYGSAYRILGEALFHLGRHAESVQATCRMLQVRKETPEAIALLEAAFRTTGIEGFWHALAELKEEQAKVRILQPHDIALLYAYAGDNDKAFYWLERMVETRGHLYNPINVNPELAKLRADPRYPSMAAKMGLEE
jgi:tetratricopeptide (TPR) repeat protein